MFAGRDRWLINTEAFLTHHVATTSRPRSRRPQRSCFNVKHVLKHVRWAADAHTVLNAATSRAQRLSHGFA